MAMIRQADLENSPRQALVLNVENIRAQAERIMDQTRQAAAAMIGDARAQRERILAGAAESGWAKGHAEGRITGIAEGRELGRAEARTEASQRLEKLEAAWTAALGEFIAQREALLRECEQGGLELAIEMGRRVSRRAIDLDRTAVIAQVGAVLGLATRGSRLTISISPEDEALVRDSLPALLAMDPAKRHVDVKADSSVPRGSCVALCDGGGVLDARIETLIDSLVREILPVPVGTAIGTSSGDAQKPEARAPGAGGES